jgi:hypothetical protein
MPAEGITPGERVCEDAQPGRLEVDFVYPESQPRPLALEVTTIVDPDDMAGARASEGLSQRLTKAAEDERLGSWIVSVHIDRDFRRLEREILTVIRDAQPVRARLLSTNGSIRLGRYTAEELRRLPHDQWGSFIAEHERLKELGLNEVWPVELDRDNYVGVLPGKGFVVRGFDEELRERLSAKAKVLGKVGDFQRHLAVFVDRSDVAGDPESMAVPELPPTIDVLWVVNRWSHGGDQPEIWVTRRWRSSWNVYPQGRGRERG